MLKKGERLSRPDQFQAVYEKGRRIELRWCTIRYRVNGRPYSRFTAVVRKKFGSAVERNRAKRRARSLFRLEGKNISPGCDIIFFLKKYFQEEKMSIFRRNFAETLREKGLYKKGK